MNGARDSLLLEHDGLRVAVHAPAADAAWLAEFLAPGFARAAGAAAAEVSFGGGVNETSDREDGELRVAFALDAGPVRLPVSVTDGVGRALEPDVAVAYDVSVGRAVAGVRYGADRRAARVRLLRVVREYAHNHALATGGIVLHAAAVATERGAVLLACGKGAGKTTATLRLLAAGGSAFLSNDRVLVRVATPAAPPGGARALAVPTIVALRASTLALVPGVAARIARCGDFRDAAAERRPGAPVSVGDTVRLSPPQLCEAVGCAALGEAPVAAILFVDRALPVEADDDAEVKGRPAPSGGVLRRLDCAVATDLLAASLLGAAAGTYTSELFVTGGPLPAPAELRTRCAALAGAVACYAGELPDSADATDLAAVLERPVSGA